MLTRFEKTRVVSARALQIAMGAPVLVKLPPGVETSYGIAVEEFNNSKLPLTVIRTMPNGEQLEISLEGEFFG